MMPTFAAHIRSFVLPVTASVIVPGTLLVRAGWSITAARVAVGGLAIGGGLAMLAWTVGLFARVGRGTLAPWAPTRRLVIVGPYAHVRNPMITGVLAIVIGEAISFGSRPLATWAALFLAINHVYFVLSEEPGLVRRFGAEYDAYRRAVPRWLPRLRPWRPSAELQRAS